MQRMPYKMRGCTMHACGYQLNPLEADCAIPAGEACQACMEGQTLTQAMQINDDCLYAAAHIADQRYLAGYCPAETLKQGTYFPELVRPYMK